MQSMFIAAAAVALITGLVHSLLGEVLIFRHLRRGGLVPTMAAPPLRARNIRIIWATWHLASVFGWAFAGILFRLAIAPDSSASALLATAIVLANLAGSLLVLIATEGKHPGWIALLLVAALTWFGANAA